MRFSDSTLQAINSMPPIFLKRDKSGKGYCCPKCSSGRGKNGTGIVKHGETGKYKCFSCDLYEDVIGLWIQHTGEDFTTAVNNLTQYYSLKKEMVNNKPIADKPIKEEPVIERDPSEKVEYKSYFLEMNRNILKAQEYLSSRGISVSTASALGIGYDDKWRHPKAPNVVPPSPRLIIPTSSYSYLARDVRSELDETQKKYSKSKVGEICLYTATIENNDKPIFVVEGEIDAISFREMGCNALALGSTSMWKKAVEYIDKHRDREYILSLDNDASGKKTTAEMKKALEEKGIEIAVVNPYEKCKDANEYLVKDRDSFESIVKKINSLKDANDTEYRLRNSVAHKLTDFYSGMMAARNKKVISTGFKRLDNLLGGGLYSGLYFIGAISSLGKTTFMLQIMDNIAKSETDVLIFSLEMASTELIAKSISRLTLDISLREQHTNNVHRKTTTHAKTTRSILNGNVLDEPELIGKALEEYGTYAEHIYITEGMGNIGVADITEKVQRHIETTGRKPVVLIDYLQILSPKDPHFTDKQNTDQAVVELKRLSRDFDISVIGISSFNRMSYDEPVSMVSFKESGAVEYSSDVLMALQYTGMDYQNGESETKRKARIRELISTELQKANNFEEQEIQLKILKNRNGRKGDCVFGFTPVFNRFSESKEEFIPSSDSDGNFKIKI